MSGGQGGGAHGVMRRTSQNYRSPFRPWWVRGLNAAWGQIGEWAQAPLSVDAWFRVSKAPSGWDRTPFEVLAESLRAEAHLHPVGRAIVQARIVGALRARRQVEAEEASAWVDEPAPIVIIGLQRTGTTLLHRLLSAVPGHRGLHSYEVLAPVGPQGARIRSARLAAWAVRQLAPDFQAVHPIDPELPEEEVVLFEHVGLSTGFEATLRVPSYAAWLEAQPQAQAYAWLRRVLATLHTADAPRWVLKTPHHLEFLDDLITAFPNARLIWMHRDPQITVPSFCSMVAHGHGLCTDAVDPEEIGAHWLRKTGRMVERGLAFRKERPDISVMDVGYNELVADPVATVTHILKAVGTEVTPQLERGLAERVRRSPRHRFGQHAYAAADFGLTSSTIAARFENYRTQFSEVA